MASGGYKQGSRVGITSVYIVLGTMLVLICPDKQVTCQGFAGCRESYFLSYGECLPCPDHCITCISDTNCTGCTDNHYGPFCQHACEEECTDQCHKVHGYCTYGCVDGRFPEKYSGHCTKCPSHCTICKSSAECIVCQPGYYGNSCENPCSNHCGKCDKRSGYCMVCANGYFNKDGQCHSCPDGCAVCYDNNRCSGCKNGHLMLYDGQCIRKCPRNEAGTYPVTNDTNDSEYMFTNGSPDIVLRAIGPCVKYIPCQSDIDCLVKGNGSDAGAALLMYECIRTYRPLNESFYRYKSECNVTTMSGYYLTSPILAVASCANGDASLRQSPMPLVMLTISMVMVLCSIMALVKDIVKKRGYRGRKHTSGKETEIEQSLSHTN